MTKPKLSYFAMSGSRGEECRLALHLAGVDFEDHRIARADWKSAKTEQPYGKVPVLRLEGKPPLGQTNAILNYIGRSYGLIPSDVWEAALHDAAMTYVDELRGLVHTVLHIDEDQRKQAREEMAAGPIQSWATTMESQIQGPFIFGSSITPADIKLFIVYNWLTTGIIDHMPQDVFAPYPKLRAAAEGVRDNPRIAEWRARKH